MCPTGTWMPTLSPGRRALAMRPSSAYAVPGEFVGDARLEGRRRRHVGGAARGVTALRLRHAAPVERARALCIHLERGVVFGDGFLVLALLEIDQSEIVECVRIVRLELQGLAAIGDSLGIILPQDGAGHAAVAVGRPPPGV